MYCLLLQIMHEEDDTTDVARVLVLEETLSLFQMAEHEDRELKAHTLRAAHGGGFHVGDKVEANFALEGTYYPAVVTAVDGESSVTVEYIDDGSSETLTLENVRSLVPKTAIRDCGGSPLTETCDFDQDNDDSICIMEDFMLKAELADLKAKLGYFDEAAALYEEAADGAMNAGKMQSASEWSVRSSELLDRN